MDFPKTRVCIVGTGFIGVASAIGLAELGHDVIGYDVQRERVNGLAGGIPPYHEDGLTHRLGRQLSAGRLRFTDSLEDAVVDARIIVVCVGTPSLPDGTADLGAMRNAIRTLLRVAPERSTIRCAEIVRREVSGLPNLR